MINDSELCCQQTNHLVLDLCRQVQQVQQTASVAHHHGTQISLADSCLGSLGYKRKRYFSKTWLQGIWLPTRRKSAQPTCMSGCYMHIHTNVTQTYIYEYHAGMLYAHTHKCYTDIHLQVSRRDAICIMHIHTMLHTHTSTCILFLLKVNYTQNSSSFL